MNELTNALDIFSGTGISWNGYFYKRSTKKSLPIPFLLYSWETDNLSNIVIDIIKTSISTYQNDGRSIQPYTPNNNKSTIDKIIKQDNVTVNSFCDKFFDNLSICDTISADITNLGGYALYGTQDGDDDKYCCIIGIGRPFKTFKNAFRQTQENKLEEVNREFYYLKPFFDLVITNDCCYLASTWAQSFIGLSSYHHENMEQVHSKLSKSGLVKNLPPAYTGKKNIFTTIEECCGNNIDQLLKIIMDKAKEDNEIEDYNQLKIENSMIDCSEPASYIALINLLSLNKIETKEAIITANALAVDWKHE